jgi:hypothetical protein
LAYFFQPLQLLVFNFDADPDFHFGANSNSDPAFHFNADLDQTYQYDDADTVPAVQNDADLC